MPFADHGLPFVAGAFATTGENLETCRGERTALLTATVGGGREGGRDALTDSDAVRPPGLRGARADLGLNPRG